MLTLFVISLLVLVGVILTYHAGGVLFESNIDDMILGIRFTNFVDEQNNPAGSMFQVGLIVISLTWFFKKTQ